MTGSRGFVGTNLKSFLTKHGFEVVDFEGSIDQKDVVLINFIQDFDAVIHLAAYGNDSSHDQTSTDGVIRTLETNILGSIYLINEFIKSKAKLFIFVGSSSEYGQQSKPMTVNTPLDGTNPYALTKASISTLLSNLQVEGKTFRVVRLFSVYGEHEKANRLIPTAFRCAMSGEEMPLGEGVHDFVHVDDVCNNFLHLLAMPEICPVVSHIASGVQTSNREIIQEIEAITHKKIYTKVVEKLRTFDTQCWVSAQDSILIKPKLSLRQGLEKVWLKLKK